MLHEKNAHWSGVVWAVVGLLLAGLWWAFCFVATDWLTVLANAWNKTPIDLLTNIVLTGLLVIVGMYVPLLLRLQALPDQLSKKFAQELDKLNALPDQMGRVFSTALTQHAVEEECRVEQIAAFAGALTELNSVLTVDSRFRGPTRELARALHYTIGQALSTEKEGPRLAYSLGVLKLLETALGELSSSGVHLSKNFRNYLYEEVGKSAKESIIRIEPMDRWPHNFEKRDPQWSWNFCTVLENLGQLANTRKIFVLLCRNENPELRVCLTDYLRPLGWEVHVLNRSDVVTGLVRNHPLRNFDHELEAHHFVVDCKLDLIADLRAMMPDAAGLGHSPSTGMFDWVQPPVKAKFFRHDDNEQASRDFVAAVLGLLSNRAAGLDLPQQSKC